MNAVEYWDDNLSKSSPALHDLAQLLKAPGGIRVVTGKNNDGDLRPFDCSLELVANSFASRKFLVVNEGFDSGSYQGGVEVAGECVARVFAPKTQEHVVFSFFQYRTNYIKALQNVPY